MEVINMKRANGKGSIEKVKGNLRKPYRVRLTKYKDGKRERISLGYFSTLKEAHKTLEEYLISPYDLEISMMTFKDLYEVFYKMKKDRVAEETLKGYRHTFKRCKELHNILFKDITTPQLQYLIDTLNKADGKKASIGTMKQTKRFLTAIYNFAIKMEYITINRAKNIDIMKESEKENRTGIFTNIEIKKLWDNINNFDWVDVILIMIHTGYRIEEIVRIKKENVDFINGIIRGGNKTEKGKHKIIPIHKDIMELIQKRYGDSNTDYLIDNRNWVIKKRGEENKPLRKNYLREKFYDVMEALGMSHRPHDTRRTFATILSKLGASESVITDLMGHTSFKTTEKYYIQNDIETLKEAIGQIEKIN